MPTSKHKLPSYCLHKASGQAIVWINGREHYLGKYGSPESHANYRKIVSEWKTIKTPKPFPQAAPEELRADLRINELLVVYLDFAVGYYVKNGRPTGEYNNMKDAIRPLQALYDTTRVWAFGPATARVEHQQQITPRS